MGYYLPEKVLTNQDLEKIVDTSDEWIRQRTGIELRHIAGENELPSDMALKASLQALEQSKLKPEDLDLILVATLYPDQLMPNTACELQRKLGISNIPALDISAACSGFVYGLSIASQYIQGGTYKNILVVGAETLHHITNYEDRTTCILFGDGAGAFVISQTDDPKSGCIYHQELKAYGDLGELLYIPSPGARQAVKKEVAEEKSATCINMDGQKVFKKAVQIMCEAYEKTLKDTKRTPDQIDWLVPHQANERILKKFCKSTSFPEEKVIFDIKETGNTSSASIPLSVARAVEKGKIKRGQDILMVAMGGGMTSGSVFLRY
jgi:3-oxoacyl-[acyl-carrier-protein] synthase-3